MYVVDQIGKIWRIENDGNRSSRPLLDLTSVLVPLTPAYDERGLLGLAFHPDYKNNCRFYVYYQLPPRAGGPAPGVPWDNLSRISEFTANCDTKTAIMSSEKVLLEWDDPQSNHNGGTLAFGPDGYLYISIGDGGRRMMPEGGKATSVVGGFVYRGHLIHGWNGKYIFGTFSQTPTTANGELFAATPGGSSWPYEEVSLKSHPDDIGYYLKGFGQDNDGEIYLTVSSKLGPEGTTGKVFKIVEVKSKNEMGETTDNNSGNGGNGGY